MPPPSTLYRVGPSPVSGKLWPLLCHIARRVADPCHPHVTLMSPSCHPHVTLMSPSCHPRVTLRSPSGHPQVTLRSPSCHPRVTLIFQGGLGCVTS
jgi:hypothetical protein